jgi:hypothetical protein
MKALQVSDWTHVVNATLWFRILPGAFSLHQPSARRSGGDIPHLATD